MLEQSLAVAHPRVATHPRGVPARVRVACPFGAPWTPEKKAPGRRERMAAGRQGRSEPLFTVAPWVHRRDPVIN